MGRAYRYDCPRCGYRAEVSGGIDQGFSRIVQTIECCDCRRLHDVPIRLRASGGKLSTQPETFGSKPTTTIAGGGDPALFAVLADKLLNPGLTEVKWTVVKPGCPVSQLHRTKSWKDPGKCPRCGVFLERTVLPYSIWD